MLPGSDEYRRRPKLQCIKARQNKAYLVAPRKGRRSDFSNAQWVCGIAFDLRRYDPNSQKNLALLG